MPYSVSTVAEAWANHSASFESLDVDRVLLDYTEASECHRFTAETNLKETFKGLSEIRAMFVEFFARLTDISGHTIHNLDIDEENKQVLLVWENKKCGYGPTTVTFMFDENWNVARQNELVTPVR